MGIINLVNKAMPYFYKDERSNWRIHRDAPGWLKNLVSKAHGEISRFPENWKMDFIHEAFTYLKDYKGVLMIGREGLMADTEIRAVTRWLASDDTRHMYLSQAIKAERTQDGKELLQLAQELEKNEVLLLVDAELKAIARKGKEINTYEEREQKNYEQFGKELEECQKQKSK